LATRGPTAKDDTVWVGGLQGVDRKRPLGRSMA
jgi:hypothetical protein